MNETSQENADSLINDIKVGKTDIIKITVERDMILARVEKHVRALQTLVSANVEQKEKLTDIMTKIRELFQSGRLIDR